MGGAPARRARRPARAAPGDFGAAGRGPRAGRGCKGPSRRGFRRSVHPGRLLQRAARVVARSPAGKQCSGGPFVTARPVAGADRRGGCLGLAA